MQIDRLNAIRLRCVPLFCLGLVLLAGAGCKSIGPATIQRDRLHYSSAVAESWKEQLLLNIVKTRFGDPPAFLEVSSVVSGYSLETGVSVNGQFSPENLRGDSFAGGELSGKFTDRPTISYAPMTGDKFARSLMAPVPLDSLLFTVQGGAPADFILGLILQSIEGHYNRSMFGGEFQRADPPFTRMLHLFRRLQRARAMELEIVKQADNNEVWLRFHAPPDSDREALAELRKLLAIPDGLDRVRIVFGAVSPDPETIAMRTRSLMQIMNTLGAGVRLPPEHLAASGAIAVEAADELADFVVHCGRDKPGSAFAAVPYGGWWFWIDRQDLGSKTTLAAVTILFNFLEGGGTKAAPVLTIPAN